MFPATKPTGFNGGLDPELAGLLALSGSIVGAVVQMGGTVVSGSGGSASWVGRPVAVAIPSERGTAEGPKSFPTRYVRKLSVCGRAHLPLETVLAAFSRSGRSSPNRRESKGALFNTSRCRLSSIFGKIRVRLKRDF